MAGRIFINYRRGDEPGFAGRLFDRLEQAFAPDQLFMDVDSIPAGEDFVRVLETQVDQCDVLLAIIGEGWTDARDKEGRRRLEQEDDFVRIEIASALKLGKRVIPVLIGDAQMLRVDELPEPLKPLARRNAVRLTHDRFKADAQGLIRALEGALDEAEATRRAGIDADAAARRLREQDDNRRAQEQEREGARLSAIAGLSAEQIAKAEELANWEFIKDSKDVQDFRDHLARFPRGTVERIARRRLAALVWEGLGPGPDSEAVASYLEEFPDGLHAEEARRRGAALAAGRLQRQETEERQRQETEAWSAASAAGDLPSMEAFLRDWPTGSKAKAAQERIRELRGGAVPRDTAVAIAWFLVALFGSIGSGFAFDALGWGWQIQKVGPASDGRALCGWIFGAAVAVASAVFLARRNDVRIGSQALAVYWVGSALIVSLLLWPMLAILGIAGSAYSSGFVGFVFFLANCISVLLMRQGKQN